MWTKNANLPNAPVLWQGALDYVAGMNAGTYENFGYHDWRLPNRKELHSLTDFSQNYPALPSSYPFTNVQSSYYWSSTSYAGYANYTEIAYSVNMKDGYVGYATKSSYYYYYTWPVRGGQAQPLECSTWGDVVEEYQAYKNGQATLRDVINCYIEWREHSPLGQ